jgi:hypothetical protein
VNRLTRDEILHRAINEAHLGGLNEHDRPGGVFTPEAYSLAWLQDGLDLFHHLYPVAGQIVTANLTFTANVGTVSLIGLTRMTALVRDGLMVVGPGQRLRARLADLNHYLDWKASGGGAGPQKRIPTRYLLKGSDLLVWPTPDQAYTAELDYYSLPLPLTKGSDLPVWPSDQVLVDYVVTKAREFSGQAQPGTAMAFAEATIAKLRSAGQLAEVTDHAIPLDPTVFRPMTAYPDYGSWMGSTAVPA